MRMPTNNNNMSSSNMENSMTVEELSQDAEQAAAEQAAEVEAARAEAAAEEAAAEDAAQEAEARAADAYDNTQSSFMEEEIIEEAEATGESLATGAFTNDSQQSYGSEGSDDEEELVEEVVSEDEEIEEEFVDDDGEYTVEEVIDEKGGMDLSQVEEAEDSAHVDESHQGEEVAVEDASEGAEVDPYAGENVASTYQAEPKSSDYPPYDDDDDNTTEETSNVKDEGEQFGDEEEEEVAVPPPGPDENPWADEPVKEDKAAAAPVPVPVPITPVADEEIPVEPMEDVPLDSADELEEGATDRDFSPKEEEEEAPKDKEDEERERRGMSGVTICLGCLLCLIAAGIFIPLLLLRGDDDGDRDIVVPTPPPVTSPPTPAEPSAAPTRVILPWLESGGPFAGPAGSGLGASAVIRDNIMVTGGPDDGNGLIQSYFLDNTDTWVPMAEISGPESGSGFGTAVDIDGDGMVVGAPNAFADGTDVDVGTAFLYQFNPTSTSWEPLGPTIRSNEGIVDAGSMFGSSVAIAVFNPYRVAVGAPMNNEGTQFSIGRVYTYDYDSDGGTLTMIDSSNPLIGDASSDFFGTSVDLSTDGAVMVVGAPGEGAKSGYAKVMDYDGGGWVEVAKLDGSSGGERFGSSVVMLEESGDVVAVGAPEFNSGAGKVAVYQRQSDGSYAPIAPEIVGEAGEKLGTSGTISGGLSPQGLAVVLGTATGEVRRFDLDVESGTWDGRYSKLDPMFDGPVTSVSTTADASLLVVGGSGNDEVAVFEAEEPPSPPTPTTPTPPTPTATPETSQPTPVPPPTRWELVSGPFDSGSDTNGFGASISYGDTVVAVGAPEVFSIGAVLTYSQSNAGTWSAIGQVFGDEEGGAFGTAVDVSDSALLVGAPFLLLSSEGDEQSGGAYYYERNGEEWDKVGSTIRGATDLFGSDEEFGASVALSDNQILAIGAPGSSAQFVLGRGRLYIYEFNGDWTLRDEILGQSEDEELGTSVDISSTGTTLIVGSPSPSFTGFASVYEYAGTEWMLVGLIGGMAVGDGMGTSVKVLNPDGSLVAAGSPGYNGGAGRVVVFQKGTSEFEQLGPAIEGEAGDRLGDANSIGGSASYPSVILGTASGGVKRYDYDGSGWVLFVQTEETGYSSVAVAAGPEHGFMAAAGNNELTFYQQVA